MLSNGVEPPAYLVRLIEASGAQPILGHLKALYVPSDALCTSSEGSHDSASVLSFVLLYSRACLCLFASLESTASDAASDEVTATDDIQLHHAFLYVCVPVVCERVPWWRHTAHVVLPQTQRHCDPRRATGTTGAPDHDPNQRGTHTAHNGAGVWVL